MGPFPQANFPNTWNKVRIFRRIRPIKYHLPLRRPNIRKSHPNISLRSSSNPSHPRLHVCIVMPSPRDSLLVVVIAQLSFFLAHHHLQKQEREVRSARLRKTRSTRGNSNPAPCNPVNNAPTTKKPCASWWRIQFWWSFSIIARQFEISIHQYAGRSFWTMSQDTIQLIKQGAG